jgi:hypothetical protein
MNACGYGAAADHVPSIRLDHRLLGRDGRRVPARRAKQKALAILGDPAASMEARCASAEEWWQRQAVSNSVQLLQKGRATTLFPRLGDIAAHHYPHILHRSYATSQHYCHLIQAYLCVQVLGQWREIMKELLIVVVASLSLVGPAFAMGGVSPGAGGPQIYGQHAFQNVPYEGGTVFSKLFGRHKMKEPEQSAPAPSHM